MARLATLKQAIADHVSDGDAVAMEGFTHLIPTAAGHEIIRQGRRDLTLLRMTPDIIYDQLIGVGAVSRLVFSWGGNPGVGSLHRLRDAVENGWPRPLELVEFTHATMTAAYVAGASGLPFGVVRGAPGTDLSAHNSALRWIDNPFADGTGGDDQEGGQGGAGGAGGPGGPGGTRHEDQERVLAVSAHNPDVTIIHAQQADRVGNVLLWGIVGIQKEAALSAKRVIVTVEEVVDELKPVPGGVVLPHHVVATVCHVPGGAHPSYASGYSKRDNQFYMAWDTISRDREAFLDWVNEHVMRRDNHEQSRNG